MEGHNSIHGEGCGFVAVLLRAFLAHLLCILSLFGTAAEQKASRQSDCYYFFPIHPFSSFNFQNSLY